MGRTSVRVVGPAAVVAGVLVVAWGAHDVAAAPPAPDAASATSAAAPTNAGSSAATSRADAADGLVRVGYTFRRLPQLASNQVAVWIETASGRYVTTLFASSFTANGGWRIRPESLPHWQKASRWASASQDRIRRAARPTPGSGRQVLYWDGTDDSGTPVAAGTYRFLVEGAVHWEREVLFTGTIALGGSGTTRAEATAAYSPAAASSETMVTDVWAGYEPRATLDPSMVTTYTRGS